MSYSIFFDYSNKTYRLPVNPEHIEISSNMVVEKYEILKLGQISVPTHMELKEYSFECELPKEPYSYVETPKKFKNSDYYLKKFENWRTKKKPVRFMASNGIGNEINTLVLIESLTIVEKAGEEGDKYVSFKLIEYKEYGKREAPIVDNITGKKKAVLAATITNPKTNGHYIIKSGDTLWGIAKNYYGDGSKCNIIYNANKDKIKNPNLIKVGVKLIIPSNDEFSKYSAALPVMTTSTVTKKKTETLATNKAVVSDRPVAGISLLLSSISGSMQTSSDKKRSSSGRSLKQSHSSGGRSF